MARTITLIPGDGIGPEITESVCQIFRHAGVEVEWERHDAGVGLIFVSQGRAFLGTQSAEEGNPYAPKTPGVFVYDLKTRRVQKLKGIPGTASATEFARSDQARGSSPNDDDVLRLQSSHAELYRSNALESAFSIRYRSNIAPPSSACVLSNVIAVIGAR